MTENKLNDNPLFRGALQEHLKNYDFPLGVSEMDLNFYEFKPREDSLGDIIGVMIAVPAGPREEKGHNSAIYHRYYLIDGNWTDNYTIDIVKILKERENE